MNDTPTTTPTTSDSVLVLESEDALTILPPDCLLFCIDDTGQEHLADKKYPIFGLGGCGVFVSDYSRLIDLPWRHMKSRWFGGADVRLHAAALGRPTEDQMAALNHFFVNFQFLRVATVLTDRTTLEVPESLYHLAVATVIDRIKTVAKWLPVTTIAIVVEASERGDPLARKFFGKFGAFEVQRQGVWHEIPITYFFAPKGTVAALEVADFVIHAAGTTVRQRMRPGPTPKRPDFEAVFQPAEKRLSSFMQVTKALPTPPEPP